MIEHPIREKLEIPEPAERRAFRVVVHKVPVPVLRGRQAGENGGNRSRAIAQHGAQRLPKGQEVREKLFAFDETPPQSVNQHEKVDSSAATHLRASARAALTWGCQKHNAMRLGKYKSAALNARASYPNKFPVSSFRKSLRRVCL